MVHVYTYMHSTADTKTPFYIGKGKGGRAYDLRPEKRGAHWGHKVAKHGVQVDILCRWSTDQEAHAHEVFLIKTMREIGIKLVNKTDGGEGASGYKWPDEKRAQLSAMARVRMARDGNPMLGREHTDQARAKQSAAKQDVFVGSKHPRASIDEATALKVKSLKGEMTAKAVSEFLGVSYHVVRNIWSNKSWRNVRG